MLPQNPQGGQGSGLGFESTLRALSSGAKWVRNFHLRKEVVSTSSSHSLPGFPRDPRGGSAPSSPPLHSVPSLCCCPDPHHKPGGPFPEPVLGPHPSPPKTGPVSVTFPKLHRHPPAALRAGGFLPQRLEPVTRAGRALSQAHAPGATAAEACLAAAGLLFCSAFNNTRSF